MHSSFRLLNLNFAIKSCSDLRRIRRFISRKAPKDFEIKRIRNLGILAHIDAGKTTTTERMLYYSGLIHQPGEVHHGNTVTDYMEQERERGITITSAVISVHWSDHQLNLIDTPGHIDFTMEVEQTLNVLDGAVVILDASAGVEAQTITVWRQADRYQIPRLAFLNKMDRKDASCSLCCQSLENKLELPTIMMQLPVIENNNFIGVVDLIGMRKIVYKGLAAQKGQMTIEDITEKGDPKLWNEAKLAKSTLIDKLSNHDDNLANTIIASESLDLVKEGEIVAAVKQAVLNNKLIPVLIGSAYKNIGIEPLMDSIISYLPNPLERNTHFSHFGNDLCAKAFKVIHDKQKGPLAFFRIYNGEIIKGQKLYNIQLDKNEQAGRLYNAYADDFVETDVIKNGNIAVVAGLKETVSGNFVTTSSAVLQRVKKKILPSKGSERTFEELFGAKVQVPEPVFFCSVEPASLAYQSKLEHALLQLQREDPSLKVRNDPETGQTILAGMGELHLEIIKDRIIKEHNIQVELGPLQIAYREAPITKVKDSILVENKIGNTKQMVNLTLSVFPSDEHEILKLDKTADAASNIAGIFPKHLLAIRQGIEVGLSHGPKINSQVVTVAVMLHWLEVGRGTSETVISACTTQLVHKLLQQSGTFMLEPVMSLEIVLSDEYTSTVLPDLSRRRAKIRDVTTRRNNKVVIADVPLAELLGYSTFLRTITSGTATFSMQFYEYQIMSAIDEEKAIQSVRGF